MEVIKFPLDFDTLDKGSVIPQSKIEEILGKKANEPGYQFELLELRNRILSELAHRGKKVAIKQDHGDLVILNDGEASVYLFTWEIRHLRGYMRKHDTLLAVDSTKLSLDEKVEHRKRIEISSKYAQTLSTTTRTIMESPSGRMTLPLPATTPKKRVI